MTPMQVHEGMTKTLQIEEPSYAMVNKWVAQFKRCRTSIKDDPRSGRPKAAASNDENIENVEDMVLSDRRITVEHIAN